MASSATGASSAFTAADHNGEALHLGLLVGRILLVLIFPLAGYLKATGWTAAVALMQSKGLPVPPLTAAFVIAVEFVLPALIILGLWTRPAALCLALYTVATAFIGHPFWNAAPAAWFGQFANFWKNISMAGGMVVLAMAGPGRYALRP